MFASNAVAFKEWAVVCGALADGRQVVILRKGGIAEEGGAFAVQAREFWLFPTHLHQNPEDLVPEARGALDRVAAATPPPGAPELRLYAEIVHAATIARPEVLPALAPFHVWSERAVRERFERWREAGVTALLVRVHALPEPRMLAPAPEYGGCKSWVRLREAVPTTGARPVLAEERFAPLAASARAILEAGSGSSPTTGRG